MALAPTRFKVLLSVKKLCKGEIMRKIKKGNLFAMFTAGLCIAALIGCGSVKSEDPAATETEEMTEQALIEVEPESESITETEEETASEPESISEEESSEDPADEASSVDHDIYEKFLKDELKLDGKTYSEIFSFMQEDFGMDPVAFYYDVDEDGKDELLVSTLFYGYNIYDVRDGELLLLDCGDGTAAACGVYKSNGHVYVSHSDFSHAGRQLLTLTRYNEAGEVVETIEINAEYWDDEDDMYDENSDFTYNGQKITMQEYEEHMNALEFIDPDAKGAKPAP